MKIKCFIFGHKLGKIHNKHPPFFASCEFCKRTFEVSYDMSSGDTLIEGEVRV